MNDSPEALAVAMVQARFADEDEARMAELDRLIRRRIPDEKTGRPSVGRLCSRGHNDWGTKRNGKYLARYCRTCNAEREKERRGRS